MMTDEFEYEEREFEDKSFESSLNRILKSINAMYRSSEPSDEKTRSSLIKQKLAVEKELEKREREGE